MTDTTKVKEDEEWSYKDVDLTSTGRPTRPVPNEIDEQKDGE